MTPIASAFYQHLARAGGGLGLLDVAQDLWTAVFGDFDCVHPTIIPAMKLARPNVFHPRIVLAGCRQLVDGDGDDAGLIPALSRRGLHARWRSWDDPDTLRADVVILRATWDYAERLDEFLAWTTSVRHLSNAPAVVAWNADKRYLLDVERRGVPIVPTEVFGPSDRVRLPAGEVVVKPSIGVGSVDAQRFTDRAAAQAHAAALQEQGRSVLVQPYDDRVERAGETALVFLGGKPSTRSPRPRCGLCKDSASNWIDWKMRNRDSLPPTRTSKLGRRVRGAGRGRRQLEIAAGDFLYARVDVIGGFGDPRLLELESSSRRWAGTQLDERTRDLQQREFARRLSSALERLGLVALHRRR